MRYVIELESIDYEVLQQAVAHYEISTAIEHHRAQADGRGSRRAILMGQRLNAAARVKRALVDAKSNAVIPRSTGTVTGSLQVGEDMNLIYGRPRPVKSGQRP